MTKLNSLLIMCFVVLLTACASNPTTQKTTSVPDDIAYKSAKKVRVWISPKYVKAIEKEEGGDVKYQYIWVRKPIVSRSHGAPNGEVPQ